MHHYFMEHNVPLVFLSFAVALLASYTALDMGTRLRRANGKARQFWLAGSSVVLGGGIWSMHFVAMLALNAGVPVGYDFDLTALSLLIAIAIMAVGFHIVTRTDPSITRQLVAGSVVGCGVAAMHYTGMKALILAGTIQYDVVLVAASILVAIIAATLALWLTLNLISVWQRVGAAAIMAIAVCGMHYTAMLGTSIAISPDRLVAVDPVSRWILAVAISIGLFLILCLAIVCVFADRHFEFLSEREATSLRAANMRLRGEIDERQAIQLELLATNAALTETQDAIRNLLDNADQGFLTVAADLRVGDQSSAACDAILGEAPAGKPIIELLSRCSPHDRQTAMRATLESVFRDSSDFIRDLKLGLLPTVFDVDGRSIRASYKYLTDSSRLMVILTDVTQAALLTEAVERERQRLEMIVLAVTEGATFGALVNDYQLFLTDELTELMGQHDVSPAYGELHRRVHTYKGLLAQFNFPRSPRVLHHLETSLSPQTPRDANSASEAIGVEALLEELGRDLASVTDVLGADFVLSGRRLMLSQRQLQAMEIVARDTLADAEGTRRIAGAPSIAADAREFGYARRQGGTYAAQSRRARLGSAAA